MRRWLLPLLLIPTFAFAADPVKVCVAQPNGAEAKNWRIQAPLAKHIETAGTSKQMQIVAPTLNSDDEKHAKNEATEKGCTYIVLTTIEKNNQGMFGTFDPSPTGAPSASPTTSSVGQASVAPTVKYKIITPNGKKVAGANVPMALKPNPTPADFQEAGRKMIESLANGIVDALPKPQ